MTADEYVLDTAVVRDFIGSVQAASRRPSRRPTRSSASAPASRNSWMTPIGCPTDTASPRPRAGWAAGSASGSCTAPATARCRCSAWWSPLPRRRRCTTIWRGAWSGCTAAPRTRRSSRTTTSSCGSTERRSLRPGEFYALLPPRDDIHRVRTTSAETSVSIHLLANDTGCVWRHAYDPDSGEQSPFRSGYVNAPCVDR